MDTRFLPNSQTQSGALYNEGLRRYLLRVYNYMGLGLVVTGVVAFLVYSAAVSGNELTAFGQAIYTSPLKYVLWFGPFALVMFISFRLNKMSIPALQLSFWLYAASIGAMLSSLGLAFNTGSIARAFFITAATFGALSLYGYTTKRDLTGLGTFMFMGLIGVVIASLVNLFMGSSTVSYVISIMSVIVFTGLTAYDTQMLKTAYIEHEMADTVTRKAISGALNLYMDFINLFLAILRLTGSRD